MNGADGTNRRTTTAIDTVIGIDIGHFLIDMKTLDGTYSHAFRIAASGALVGYNIGHGQLSSYVADDLVNTPSSARKILKESGHCNLDQRIGKCRRPAEIGIGGRRHGMHGRALAVGALPVAGRSNHNATHDIGR